jgi:DNA-binding transcriptional LysR family regulator
MDRLAAMTSFVKVVENGGFSAAARRLDISTSIVTTHVQALEELLGVRLLNRSTRKVNLTDVGQAYYDRPDLLRRIDDVLYACVAGAGSRPRPWIPGWRNKIATGRDGWRF